MGVLRGGGVLGQSGMGWGWGSTGGILVGPPETNTKSCGRQACSPRFVSTLPGRPMIGEAPSPSLASP